MRVDSAATRHTLVEELRWSPIAIRPDQIDLEIDLATGSAARMPILTLKHGCVSVLRTRDPARLIRASRGWLGDITTSEPDQPHFFGMSAGLTPDGRAVLVPRWLTATTALLERFVPDQTRWLDRRWIPARLDDSRVTIGFESQAQISAVAIDGFAPSHAFTTPGRRAIALLQRVGGPAEQRLDLALALARSASSWRTVEQHDPRTACRAIAELLGDNR